MVNSGRRTSRQTPKALTNSSPAVGAPATALGNITIIPLGNPERVRQLPNPFRVTSEIRDSDPMVVAALQPWALISQRPRRISNYCERGEKLGKRPRGGVQTLSGQAREGADSRLPAEQVSVAGHEYRRESDNQLPGLLPP